jgi:branched-chain amino acid transport system permease protein
MGEELRVAFFLQILIYGIGLGSIYALFSLGFTLIFGILKVLNLAHGGIYMLAAVIAYTLINSLGLNVVAGFLIACIIAGLVGILQDLLLFRPLRLRGITGFELPPFIGSIAFNGIIMYGVLFFFGAETRAFTYSVVPETNLEIGSISVSSNLIVATMISIALMAGLYYLVHNTKTGKAMRAIAEKEDAARLMGISVNRIIMTTLFISSFLGGVAGVLNGMFLGDVSFSMGGPILLKGLCVIMVGGIGSIRGTLFAGFLLGIIETFFNGYGLTLWSPVVAFAAVFLILYFKPTGIMGKERLAI